MRSAITYRQGEYIKQLAKERGIPITNEKWQRVMGMTMDEASRLISWLKDKPKTQQPFVSIDGQGATQQPQRLVERGAYRTPDGNLYIVVKSRGRQTLYAKQIIVTGRNRVVTRYVPGVYQRLTEDMKVSAADARQFGLKYGVCCMCARTLTDPDSIALGIGPVCRARYFGIT